MMRQLWSIFVALALVLGLGLSEAPRPCHGDGHGHACNAAACQCDATCTCKLDHLHDALATEVADATTCQGGHASAAAREARLHLSHCHGAGGGPKFAMPLKQWVSALSAVAGWTPERSALLGPRLARQGTDRPHAPPYKPPTSLA